MREMKFKAWEKQEKLTRLYKFTGLALILTVFVASLIF
jgi:hypothetical protein